MIGSEIKTSIVFDSKGKDDLLAASNLLYEIDDAFGKSGAISVDDPDRLHIRGAIGVINSILNGETF